VNRIRIGDQFDFVAEAKGSHDFVKPSFHGNTFIGSKGYGITKMNRLDLRGTVDNKPITGSAYFQRVFVNAPAVPWYWGGFHFANGAVLTYTNQMVLRKAIKKHVAFFDGKELYEMNDVNVKRIDAEGKDSKTPIFKVTGETKEYKVTFTVKSYAHSFWQFKKKTLGILPEKLTYNEYPSTINDFEFIVKKTNKKITSKELGKAVGNAEHTTGYLL
jgi:hypothetical protein